jgi:hypothetical protein
MQYSHFVMGERKKGLHSPLACRIPNATLSTYAIAPVVTRVSQHLHVAEKGD